MPDPSLLQRLKERKLVQWVVAYLAGAWVIYEATGTALEAWDIPVLLVRSIHVLLVLGFLITLVLAWYHGEKGRQRVSGPELLMVAALLVVAGVALSMLGGVGNQTGSEVAGTLPILEDDRPSIAVLPLDNFSPDPSDAYFADGVHEEIISRLSKVASLRVTSRNSVMRYREEKKLTRQVATELGVGFILEGSARIGGGMVRLTLQLIDGDTDEHLWSEDYDRPFTVEDFIPIQSEIAQEIARALQVNIAPDEQDRIAAAPTDDINAFIAYLEGRTWLPQRTGEGLQRARELFEEAIQYDIGFARAYAGLADAYALLGVYEWMPFEEAFALGEAAALRALELDPALGEAFASLGFIQRRTWNWEESLASLQRAIELDPANATGYQWYGGILRDLGRVSEAIQVVEQALLLEPLSPVIRYAYALALFGARQFDRASEEYEKLLNMQPDFPVRDDQAVTRLYEGRVEEAISYFAEQVEVTDSTPASLCGLAWAKAMAGDPLQAERLIMQVLERTDGGEPVPPLDLAKAYVALGEVDSAFFWLERAFEDRALDLTFIKTTPEYDGLRADPRYATLLTRMGFQP